LRFGVFDVTTGSSGIEGGTGGGTGGPGVGLGLAAGKALGAAGGGATGTGGFLAVQVTVSIRAAAAATR
jgi:hypothetical protein